MASYWITHSCGHEARHQILGPQKQREWRVESLESELCSDCYRARLDEKNRGAAEANKKDELPPLRGTAPQILWAEGIRREKIDAAIEAEWSSEVVEKLCAEDRAYWWIDNRSLPEYLLHAIMKERVEGQKRESDVSGNELLASAEATMRPENPETETVAELSVRGRTISIAFPEFHEEFRSLMRGSKFRWEGGQWTRTPGNLAGKVEDRAAEMVHRMIACGFIVRCYDEELRRRGISGEFEPEHERWIYEKDGKFAILWPRDENWYKLTRRLTGARWDSDTKVMRVSPEGFEDVVGFAEVYEFRLTKAAQLLCEKAEEAKRASLVVSVSTDKSPKLQRPSSKPTPLPVPEEVQIDESLRDDD